MAEEVAKVVAESGERKTRQKNGFFSTLASDLSPRQLSPHSLMPFAKWSITVNFFNLTLR